MTKATAYRVPGLLLLCQGMLHAAALHPEILAAPVLSQPTSKDTLIVGEAVTARIAPGLPTLPQQAILKATSITEDLQIVSVCTHICTCLCTHTHMHACTVNTAKPARGFWPPHRLPSTLSS